MTNIRECAHCILPLDQHFRVGDIVTRRGLDEFRVVQISANHNGCAELMDLVCVKAPPASNLGPPWIEVGGETFGQPEDYKLVRPALPRFSLAHYVLDRDPDESDAEYAARQALFEPSDQQKD